MLSTILDGPGAVAIHLRAGWSLGSVQDRYIFSDSGQDQFCGRCVNGFPLTETCFAVLPPHFLPDFAIFDGDELAGWRSIVPGYDTLPMGFKSVLRFLLASLVYHQDWLRDNLPAAHPLFSSPVFLSGHVTRLRPFVHCGEFVNEASNMAATGIPPSMAQLKKIADLTVLVEKAQQDLTACTESVREAVHQVPNRCVEEMLKRIRVDGAMEVTTEDVQRVVEATIAPLSHSLQLLLQRGVVAAAPVADDHKVDQLVDGADVSRDPECPEFDRFTWGGKMLRIVPPGFCFPEYV
jgi:hypothetical protein